MNKNPSLDTLKRSLQATLKDHIIALEEGFGELTIEVDSAHLLPACQILQSDDTLHFEQLTDLCGVDYLVHGRQEWTQQEASNEGFSRAVHELAAGSGRLSGADNASTAAAMERRFASVIHLLSYRHNHRLRLRCFATGEPPIVPSLVSVWPAANWYEREAFDLFGILFEGHPDLRRLLSDYGFIGHPLRKDFPLNGRVEMRYDPAQERVIYETVSIEPRVNVPRVIRKEER